MSIFNVRIAGKGYRLPLLSLKYCHNIIRHCIGYDPIRYAINLSFKSHFIYLGDDRDPVHDTLINSGPNT